MKVGRCGRPGVYLELHAAGQLASQAQRRVASRSSSRDTPTAAMRGCRVAGASLALRYLFGPTGGLSLLNTSRFFAMYDSQAGGTSSSVKIAVTGHSGTQAPQSMHSSGWM